MWNFVVICNIIYIICIVEVIAINSQNNPLKEILLALLNPISPIITLLVGFLLSALITIPNDNLPYFINILVTYPVFNIIFLILWLIMSIIYTIMDDKIKGGNKRLDDTIKKYKKELDDTIKEYNKELNDKDKIIKEKNSIIREKESQLANTSNIVLNKAGDFADFSRLLRFNEALKGFVDNNTIVECAQMYSYSTKRVNNSVIIRVCYDCSYCSDEIDINNLAQCHYEIDYNDYNILKSLISSWKKLASTEYIQIPEKDILIKYIVNQINSLYKKYYNTLNDLSDISEINNFHFSQYRILTLLSRLARRKSTTMFDKNRILKAPPEIENYLLNGKRTGILNSILLEDIFMFKYTRNSHKKDGRAYVAFPLNISMQNYIFVFSIQTIDLDENIDLEFEINSLKNDIVKRFEKR